jgi:hypothetical protein
MHRGGDAVAQDLHAKAVAIPVIAGSLFCDHLAKAHRFGFDI